MSCNDKTYPISGWCDAVPPIKVSMGDFNIKFELEDEIYHTMTRHFRVMEDNHILGRRSAWQTFQYVKSNFHNNL